MMNIELLSPAKDRIHGIAAVNHGADAVYIGASRFGARHAATNDTREIEALCSYAHRYNAKVYVTLNTLLKDEEFPEALDIIKQVYEIGADALIIQDMGLLETDLPPIPLFASTQTHNTDATRIKFLQDVGFQRVILARELSLTDISAIRQQTTIELESFIHGAICVSYSGQCYMSQAICGRSGNRGECAQPCRSTYTLADGNGKIISKNKHLLSLRDINLSGYISEMIDAGVSSFKIEGRLKDISYVKNVTAYYRQKIDAVLLEKQLHKSSSGSCTFPFTPDLESTFSRTYTSYFISGKRQKMASFDTPKAIGKEIAVANNVHKFSIDVSARAPISNNDGLCFFTNDRKLEGFKVNKVEGNTIYPFKMPEINAGTILYRNQDIAFEKALAASDNPRRIKAHVSVSDDERGVIITAIDEDNTRVHFTFPCEKTKAQDVSKCNATIVKQFSKTGNSIFIFDGVSVNFNEALFFPMSTLNEIRRLTLEKLDEKRTQTYVPQRIAHSQNAIIYPQQELDYKANVINSLSEKFYRRHGCTGIQKGYELQAPAHEVVMTTRYCLRYELGICLLGKDEQQPGSHVAPLYLTDAKNSYKLTFDCKRCEMNLEIISHQLND